MVKEHYPQLGFATVEVAADGTSRFELDLAGFAPAKSFVRIEDDQDD